MECVMGILDLFKGKKQDKPGPSWALQRKIKKALNKFIQAPERQAALQGLADEGSEDAVRALIKRLTFYVEPLTTDENEKNYVMDALVGFGPRIIPLLIESIKTGESITWQLNTYRQLTSEEELLESLLSLIEGFDTEYEKNPVRKIQIIEALGDWKSDKVAHALERFLDDVDETVRYQTVSSLLKQDPEIMRDWLLERALSDESNRIRDLVMDGLCEREISIKGFHARKQFEEKLPPEMLVDGKGVIKRKGPKTRL
jgi:HEAT repeat protein